MKGPVSHKEKKKLRQKKRKLQRKSLMRADSDVPILEEINQRKVLAAEAVLVNDENNNNNQDVPVADTDADADVSMEIVEVDKSDEGDAPIEVQAEVDHVSESDAGSDCNPSDRGPTPNEEVAEELTSLECIFMDAFHLLCPNPPQFAIDVPTAAHPEWALALRFTLPATYPAVVPAIALQHSLSMKDFPPHVEEALVAHLVAEADGMCGQPSVFMLVSAASEWLDASAHANDAKPNHAMCEENIAKLVECGALEGSAAGSVRSASVSSVGDWDDSDKDDAMSDIESVKGDPSTPPPPCKVTVPSKFDPEAAVFHTCTLPSGGEVDFRKMTLSFANSRTAIRRLGPAPAPLHAPRSQQHVAQANAEESSSWLASLSLGLSRRVSSEQTAIVELFEALFYTSQKEIDDYEAESLGLDFVAARPKHRIVGRNMCMYCGTAFSSRSRLFKHIRNDSRHDITPSTAAGVMRYCLLGDPKKASALLWDTDAQAEAVLFSVLHVVLEKTQQCEDVNDRSGMWRIAVALAKVAESFHFESTKPLVEMVEARGVPDTFGTFEVQEECAICHDRFVCVASHQTALLPCSHHGCGKLLAMQTGHFDCVHCSRVVDCIDVQPLTTSCAAVRWQQECKLGTWRDLSHDSRDHIEEAYARYMDVRSLPIQARALTLEAIVKFTQDHAFVDVDGERRSIMTLTTEEVVKHAILPECRHAGKLRYCEVAAQRFGREHVGVVNVFVSHAWSNSWGLLVMTLMNNFHQRKCAELPVYFWVDVFAVCQTNHTVSKGKVTCGDSGEFRRENRRDLMEFDHPLHYAIRTFGVMDADGVGVCERDLCQRAWCLFEFATTLALGNVLSFRLANTRQHKGAVSDAGNNPNRGGNVLRLPVATTTKLVQAKAQRLRRHSLRLDLRNAKCRVQTDMEEIIHPRVAELGGGDLQEGFRLVNSTVQHALEVLQEIVEWKDNELSYAANIGNTQRLSKLLRSGEDPNQPDKSGKTPLHRACKNGHAECVRMLVEAGASTEPHDRLGATPLHTAAQHNQVQCVQALLAAGADVKARDRKLQVPSQVAAANGHAECVKLLADDSAQPKHKRPRAPSVWSSSSGSFRDTPRRKLFRKDSATTGSQSSVLSNS